MDRQSWPRAGVLVVSVGAAAFWIYAIYYLIANANPTGGGMELVGIVPLTVVLAALTLPALLLARKGRHLLVAAGLVAASVLANYFLWRALLSDLARLIWRNRRASGSGKGARSTTEGRRPCPINRANRTATVATATGVD